MDAGDLLRQAPVGILEEDNTPVLSGIGVNSDRTRG